MQPWHCDTCKIQLGETIQWPFTCPSCGGHSASKMDDSKLGEMVDKIFG